MTINELCKEAYNNAKEAGWHDEPREVGTLLMLVVSELAEAMEADRKPHHADLDYFDSGKLPTPRTDCSDFEDRFRLTIKDSFEDELADAVIRIADLCGKMGIDLERHIELKMAYNKTRGYKHGGKRY